MASDGLATQGAKASAAMVLDQFSGNITVSPAEEFEISLERVARHHSSHLIWLAAMIIATTLFLWGCLSQKQVLMTWIDNDIAENTTGYDYLSMFWISILAPSNMTPLQWPCPLTSYFHGICPFNCFSLAVVCIILYLYTKICYNILQSA